MLRKFELENFCRTIQDYKVNIAPIVPPIVLLLVNNPIARKYDLSSLKLGISAAAPLSKDLCKKFIEIYKIPIKQAYGTYFELIFFYSKYSFAYIFIISFFSIRFN